MVPLINVYRLKPDKYVIFRLIVIAGLASHQHLKDKFKSPAVAEAIGHLCGGD